MIQQMLAIWSLIPLPFLNPAWTSGSSQFTYYWSLAWRILSITLLLRNLYAGQEAIVRTGHGTTDWLQIRKRVCQCCILSPSLFNLYAEYIMWNSRLDEAQAGIKTAGRNINNLRYAHEICTLMAESKEGLKNLLMKVKESEKAGLKLNIQKLRSWHLVPSLHDK